MIVTIVAVIGYKMALSLILKGTGLPNLMFVINKDSPRPIIKLKVGLDKVPVIAILGYPFWAIIKSASKSAIQFPIANTTIPK